MDMFFNTYIRVERSNGVFTPPVKHATNRVVGHP